MLAGPQETESLDKGEGLHFLHFLICAPWTSALWGFLGVACLRKISTCNGGILFLQYIFFSVSTSQDGEETTFVHWIVCRPKIHVFPETQNMALFGKRIFADKTVMMWLTGGRVGPKSSDSCLYKKAVWRSDRDRKKKQHIIIQEMPAITSNHKWAGRAWERFPLRACRRACLLSP